MKDMKLNKSERDDRDEGMEITSEDPYPWGLTISLNEESLEKLGFDGEVGEEVGLIAKVKITSKSERENVNDSSKNIELQITEMELKKGSSKSLEKRLYGDD